MLHHNTIVRGQGRQRNNSKNKNRNFEEIIFSIFIFLHGEKENFEEYSLFLESAEFTFPILINYSARKCRACPCTTILNLQPMLNKNLTWAHMESGFIMLGVASKMVKYVAHLSKKIGLK
jgi:hypothetical protein